MINIQSPSLLKFASTISEGHNIAIEGLWDTPKALMIAIASQATQKNIIILTSGSREQHFLEDFAFLTPTPIFDFPAWETLPSESIAPSLDIVGERYKTLASILQTKEPCIVLSSLQAALQRLISKKDFNQFFLRVNDECVFENLPEKLSSMGYEKTAVTTDKGQFSVRGCLIDIFPASSPDPFRLEFFGDTLESIRAYDPIQQTSVRKVESIEILPATETIAPAHASLFDYLGKNTLLIFDDLLALEDRYIAIESIPGAISNTFISFKAFLKETAHLQKMFLTPMPLAELSEISSLPQSMISFEVFGETFKAKRLTHPFLPFEEDTLLALSRLDMPLTILSASEMDEKTFKERIKEEHITLPELTHFTRGYLSSGFIVHDIPVAIFPLTELTHRYKIRRQKQRSTYHTALPTLLELVPGDLVVHFNHGIGKYLGIEKKPNNQGIESEFLLLEYSERSKLYVPIAQSYLVSKYVGSSEEMPTLHALDSSKWKNLRSKTENAILGYAKELLTLYAKRSHLPGFSYAPDSVDMGLFESDFPFEETEDQLAAIESLKHDMCSDRCMDRLVCGDVGYGKTEVAMRAAFKAVADGQKQVAVLVPTTVLAMQHYENFSDRMRNFPVRIGVLSRFRSTKQIKETLQQVKEGSIDILIGTHRIVSKDVIFKDLGLIIIDEEQRFGVKAKEHLKTLKHGVDCLTLSATPIPRTLYMSLVGARDMSVVSTPPQDRLPIKSIICEKDDEVIQTALLRELARDGQAYFIHNRVDSIFQVKERLSKLVPNARILVAHGQMSADEIDQTFHAYKYGGADILVATTLIENGIDIPNANTILIDHAENFGLADLYQLRGRVGRWNRRAYCYFLTPKHKVLPELAQKRLHALAEVSGHGGGMRVAMRDLEIRGAGDILGTEQSGHVSAIGFHLYCKLLKRTIDTLQGKSAPLALETKLDFPQDARLPESYVNAMSLRLEIYQRLGEAQSLNEVDTLFAEVKDRFGALPLPAKWLYHLSRIRVFASLNNYTLVKLQTVSLVTERRVGNKFMTNTQNLIVPKDPALLEKKILSLLEQLT